MKAAPGEELAAPPSRAGNGDGSPDRRHRWRLAAGIAVALVLAAAVVLRFVAKSDLWLDEALSVNIAKLPLSDLPEALKRDGAPPVYYVLLHFWMDVFGESDTAVRALSGVLSLATLPAMYFAGRRLGGKWAAWAAVLVLAANPYAFRYATETRMYALVMFVVAWGYLAFVRALEKPSLGRCALVALGVAVLLYAHNWSYYLIATVGIVLLLRAWRGSTAEDRRSAWRVILAMVVGGLCYVPWLPTVAYQLKHTGTPWGDARLPWSALASAIGAFGGVGRPYHGEAYVLTALLIVLPLLALFGAAVSTRHIDIDLRTRPLVRWETVVGVGAIVVGLTLSYATGTAFDARYASVGVPLFLLVTAMGIMVFSSTPVRVSVLAAMVALGLAGGVRNAVDERTQAGQVAAAVRANAQPGDVVVYCPDQLGPSVHRVVGDGRGLVEVTFPDLARPERVDWVDYRDRIGAANPDQVAAEVLDRAGDATIWYVVSPGYRSVEGKCEALGNALGAARPGPTTHVVFDDNGHFEFMGLVEYRTS
ncbi:MAG: glycosyltransferase family 39 protein [Acidimicrobiia bacterium]